MNQKKQKIVIEIEFTGSSNDVELSISTSHQLDFDGICKEVLDSLDKVKNTNEILDSYEVAIAKNAVWVFKKAVHDGLLNDKISEVMRISQALLGEVMQVKLDKIISEHEAGK